MTDPDADEMTAELAAIQAEARRQRLPAAVGPQAAPEGQPQIHAVMDCVAVALLHIGRDGKFRHANPQARKLFKLSLEQMHSMTLADFGSRTVWQDGTPCPYEEYPAIKCLRTGEPQPASTIGVRRSSGEMMWTKVAVTPLCDPLSGRPESVIATIMDISYSHQIEESLRQSEDRYQRLVEQAPDAIVVHRAGLIVFVNDAAVKLWAGRSRADFLRRDVLDFVHPRHRAVARARMAQSMAGRTAELVEQTLLRLDGRSVHAEVTGVPCVYDGAPAVQVFLRDVTQRKRAERQVRRQREILKRFFNRIPVLVAFFDVEGRIKLVNRQWYRVLGWDRQQSLPAVLSRCQPAVHQRQQLLDYLQHAQAGWQDFCLTALDGQTLEISWANLVLSDGTRIAIGQDVTRRNATEAALQRSKAGLEQRVAERTEEISHKNLELRVEIAERRRAESELQEKQRTMAAMLKAHERNQKLVAYEIHDTFLQDVIAALMFIDASYDVRQETGEQSLDRLERARALLRKSIDEARRMISDLRPPIIDEQGVVAGIEYLINELNSRGVEVHFLHAMRDLRFSGDIEATVFRIVQEALSNVEKHSGSRFAQLTLTQPGDMIRLQITDFGVGFDPQLAREGHYGLQGIKERARLIDAAVSITSRPGEGTEIVVEIPVRHD